MDIPELWIRAGKEELERCPDTNCGLPWELEFPPFELERNPSWLQVGTPVKGAR